MILGGTKHSIFDRGKTWHSQQWKGFFSLFDMSEAFQGNNNVGIKKLLSLTPWSPLIPFEFNIILAVSYSAEVKYQYLKCYLN